MLNESEQRRLAEIDARLRVSDPDLARALSRPIHPPRRRQPAVWVSAGALIAAPWLALLEDWPLVIAAALVVAALVSGVWAQTNSKREN
jgi:hypothetical protein